MSYRSVFPWAAILLLLPCGGQDPARAAEEADVSFRPGIAAWDTGQAAEQADPPSLLVPQREWTAVASGITATVFQGDAIISNGRIALAVRRKAQAVEAYALSHEGMVLRLRLQLIASGGDPAARLERVELVENTKGAACLELTYKNAHGAGLAARFRIKKAEVAVQIDPGQGADRLRVECAGRFAVLPDFFADDILIDARNIPVQRIELPSENFLLHLAGQGETVATCVFENRKQDVVVTLAGTGDERKIEASEIPFEAKRVWVAILEGPGQWHTRDIRMEDAGKVLPLGWKMPFPAQWRVDLTRREDLTDSWDMLLEQKTGGYLKPSLLGGGPEHLGGDRSRWNTVLGRYPYPCWSDQEGRGYIQPLKKKVLSFQGPAVVYPLNRVKETPLDAFTVVDIMRNTLGVGPCEHILDLEGQKSEYRGRATCSVRDTLGAIYEKKEQKQKHAEVEKILSDGLVFVKHIRGRINRYLEFGRRMHDYLAEQRKVHPELKDFLDEMDTLTQEIDARVAARADKIQTPEHVARMNEAFRRNVLDYEGPDALERCRQYATALVVIGDNQDELSGECRWVVKSLRQRAGIRMALDPRVASVATEIRARTQEALRNPASHEGARH
jgi:hypothetical protein